jgi:hypothetical protein
VLLLPVVEALLIGGVAGGLLGKTATGRKNTGTGVTPTGSGSTVGNPYFNEGAQ